MAAVALLASEADTVAAGRRLGRALRLARRPRVVIHLRGDLGAGKTTFARGVLQGLGHQGRVPSPTYTLVEPYELDDHTVYHIDLYRIANPADVDDLGLPDLGGPGVVMLIEWPERGSGRVEPADLELMLTLVDTGRSLRRVARSPVGEWLLAHENGSKSL